MFLKTYYVSCFYLLILCKQWNSVNDLYLLHHLRIQHPHVVCPLLLYIQTKAKIHVFQTGTSSAEITLRLIAIVVLLPNGSLIKFHVGFARKCQVAMYYAADQVRRAFQTTIIKSLACVQLVLKYCSEVIRKTVDDPVE
jgi:hypothetical protein